jgi:peptide/nickel transport system substrate-binding protein
MPHTFACIKEVCPMTRKSAFSRLCDELLLGTIDRRAFIARASALGLGAGLATIAANAVAVSAAGGSPNGFAVYPGQDATPSGSPVINGADTRPTVGMENKTRGQDGELRLIQWQAISSLCRHKSGGYKDVVAADIVNEPLMRSMENGELIPNLCTEVPSVENGLLAEDLSEVTFNLKEGVLWSDGTPFTANDLRFTWQWITEPSTGAGTYDTWIPIADIEVIDDLTARVVFTAPSPAWFDPFTGHRGHIYPAHFWDGDIMNTAKTDEFMMKPLGTGPFVVESMAPNDQAVFVANENYREPNKPAFARVVIKGGGEPSAAARAVLQTGDYHYGWNLQVEPDILAGMVSEDGPGMVVVQPGTNVERCSINFSDPHTEVDGQRSEMNTPNPILSDKAVRQALALCIPRDVIAEQFYGEGQPPTANILSGVEAFESTNTSWEFNVERASQLLDDAGWALNDDGVREKDGVELRLELATTVNAVRQKTQAVIKEQASKAGIHIDLTQVDGTVFFDTAPGNDQNLSHFYWDLSMWATNATSLVPISYMAGWYSGGPERDNIPQRSNDWAATNISRWINDDYDAAYESFSTVTSMDDAMALLIQLNDMIIDDIAVIPLVLRAADSYGISRSLVAENIALGPGFELNYWNIVNWNLRTDA